MTMELDQTEPFGIAFMTAQERDEEYSDLQGAAKLKQMIEDYWARKGAMVQVDLVSEAFHPTMRSGRYEVRSDMVNALPRGWKPPA